jgi:microcystin-dependent protein
MNLQKEASSTFRRSLLVAIPIATVVGLTALAYAGLNIFSSGQPLSSTTMNANFALLQSQITALQAGTGIGPDGGTLTVPTTPSGTVVAFPGPVANIPAGWVLCDGTQYNATTDPTYAALFAAIGTANGGVAGTKEFNVPDYRGYFLRGLDSTAVGANDPNVASRTAANTGGNTGANVGSLETDGFASHSHGVTDPGHSHLYGDYAVVGPYDVVVGAAKFGSGSTSTSTTGISIQNTGGSETRPKNVAVNYIIKL